MLDRLTSEVDTVIHLATAVGVKRIVENPAHTIETHIMGMEMALNAANCGGYYAPGFENIRW